MNEMIRLFLKAISKVKYVALVEQKASLALIK